jgi:hypothetical protein
MTLLFLPYARCQVKSNHFLLDSKKHRVLLVKRKKCIKAIAVRERQVENRHIKVNLL